MVHSNPYSLLDKGIPKISLTPSNLNLSPYSHCIVLPVSLKWLLPKSIINLQHIGRVSGSLLNNEDWNSTETVVGLYETDERIDYMEEQFTVTYNLWKIEDTLIILIEENELKYPTIVTNFMTRYLSSLIKGIDDMTILVNSDRLTQLKTLPELSPPEFITGSITNLILGLSKKTGKVLVVPSEGPIGFEKYNLTTVDVLVEKMSALLCSYPAQTDFYISECLKLWKSDGCTSTQGGLYI